MRSDHLLIPDEVECRRSTPIREPRNRAPLFDNQPTSELGDVKMKDLTPCPVMMVKPTARFKVIGAALVLVGIFSGTMALGNSPLRVEGAYVPPSHFRLSGVVDITSWLAARVCLLNVYLPPEFSISFGFPAGAEAFYGDVSDWASLICSPWRGKLKIQPYAYAGLGFGYYRCVDPETDSGFTVLLGTATYGLGVEPLLFFLPHAPPLFFEIGQAFYQEAFSFVPGRQVSYPLNPHVRVAVGVRI
jgi:hypothetical protein